MCPGRTEVDTFAKLNPLVSEASPVNATDVVGPLRLSESAERDTRVETVPVEKTVPPPLALNADTVDRAGQSSRCVLLPRLTGEGLEGLPRSIVVEVDLAGRVHGGRGSLSRGYRD